MSASGLATSPLTGMAPSSFEQATTSAARDAETPPRTMNRRRSSGEPEDSESGSGGIGSSWGGVSGAHQMIGYCDGVNTVASGSSPSSSGMRSSSARPMAWPHTTACRASMGWIEAISAMPLVPFSSPRSLV